jgi:ribosomal protein L40E
LSGLTKKSVYADKVLAKILGVSEGEQVSYAELSKGLHKYIRDNNLKNPSAASATATPGTIAAPAPADVAFREGGVMKACRACEAEIPIHAIFCDLCGARQ